MISSSVSGGMTSRPTWSPPSSTSGMRRAFVTWPSPLRWNSCSHLIELKIIWIRIDAFLNMSFMKFSRGNIPKPTRWSYAPAPPTSRTCWIRIPPSTPSSSWRLLGICFKDLKALTPSSQDVPFAHLNAILEFMYAGEVRFLALWRNFLRGL